MLRCLAPLAEATGDPAVLAEADALLDGIETPPGGGLAARRGRLPLRRPRAAAPGDRTGPARCSRPCWRPRGAGWIPALVAAGLVDGRAAARLGDAAAARAALDRALELAWANGMPTVAAAAEQAIAEELRRARRRHAAAAQPPRNGGDDAGRPASSAASPTERSRR